VGQRTYSVHAHERVLEFLTPGQLDRLVPQACAAAEQSDGWCAGAEFIFELEDEPYATPGLELSALIVRHRGESYEVYYYDGPMAETITARPSWEQ
jgi:hypothetical protein